MASGCCRIVIKIRTVILMVLAATSTVCLEEDDLLFITALVPITALEPVFDTSTILHCVPRMVPTTLHLGPDLRFQNFGHFCFSTSAEDHLGLSCQEVVLVPVSKCCPETHQMMEGSDFSGAP